MTPPSAAAAPAVQPGRPLAPRRRFTTSPRPRRVSGPARRPPVDHPVRLRSPGYAGIALGLTEALSRLSQHRLLDRLIRGRAWIALVAFALIGIVTLQLGLLKLNAGIGHALQKEAALQRQNAALSIENSELAAGGLVESSASRLGMEMVPVGVLRFLTARPGADAGRAAAAMSAPVASPSTPSGTGEASGASAPAPASGSSASTEGAAPSRESASTPSSEAEASTTPSSEAAAAGSGTTGPPPTESSSEHTAPAAAGATAPATGGGSGEASGGTRAGSSGG
jgi:hypothetical protein